MRTIPLIMNDISKYIKKYKAKYQWETNTAKIIKDDKVFILNYLVDYNFVGHYEYHYVFLDDNSEIPENITQLHEEDCDITFELVTKDINGKSVSLPAITKIKLK